MVGQRHGKQQEMKDKGCFYHRPSCESCPYKDGEISFSAKCIEEYPHGVASLVADIRNSVIISLFKKGVSVTILSKVFKLSKSWTRKIISENW